LGANSNIFDLLDQDDIEGAAVLFQQRAAGLSLNGVGHADDFELVWARDVTIRPLRWFWQLRMPEQHLTLLVGDGGVGKGFIMTDLVARVTTGRPLPDDAKVHPVTNVLWVGSEDAIDSAVVPRLRAAGADVGRVAFLTYNTATPFSLPSDAVRLEARVRANAFGLIVLDSVTSYLDPGLRSNNEQDVRRALLPLNPMAQATGTTILASIHINKVGDQAAGHRILGSVAWRNVARSALVAGRLPDERDQYGLASNKTNLGPVPDSLGYRIVSAQAFQRVGDADLVADAARIVWAEDILDIAPDDLMPKKQTGERGRPAAIREEVTAWLQEELDAGPHRRARILELAKELGYARATVERAANELGVERTIETTTEGREAIWSLEGSAQ
jgi:hypothetical protein